MLRGSLLAAALFALLGFGSATGHVRNGRIAYEHAGDADRFQIFTVTATGTHRRHLTSGCTYSSWDPAYSRTASGSRSFAPRSTRSTSGR